MKRQPTTQQITWFLDLDRNKQLDLTPPYQRKSVWSTKDRKFFLDTIFNNYPAPPIFVHRDVDDKGYTTYHIVDGKQRLETILLFYQNKLSIPDNFGDENFNGKKFKDLTADGKRLFWDYTLVVDFIDTIDGKNIEEVFDRVNRNAKNLQPQELRHARFDGWFINYVEQEADKDFWWKYKISTKARDKRMRNTQFISELLMIVLREDICGFDQELIDQTYADYDDAEEFDSMGFDIDEFQSSVNEIIDTINELDRVNNIISDHISGSNINFYTIWAYLCKNGSTCIDDLPNKLKLFFDKIDSCKHDSSTITDSNVLFYYENTTGAATEYPQRKNRLEALENAMR